MFRKLLTFVCLTLLALSAKSSIINSSNSGSGYDFQELEWLPLSVTTGLSRTDILDGFVGNDNLHYTYSENADTNNGAWRYATEHEIYSLIDPNNLMATTANPFPLRKFYTTFNWFNEQFGYFENPNYGTGVENWGRAVSKFWFGKAGQGGQMTLTSGTVCWGCSISNSFYRSETGDVGTYSYASLYSYGAPSSSLLVRSEQVPTPATIWLFLIAVISLVCIKNMRRLC